VVVVDRGIVVVVVDRRVVVDRGMIVVVVVRLRLNVINYIDSYQRYYVLFLAGHRHDLS